MNTVLQFFYREYLATFKKTVAMHEVFLCRLAAHPSLRKDENFKIFLEYKQEVCSNKHFSKFGILYFIGKS